MDLFKCIVKIALSPIWIPIAIGKQISDDLGLPDTKHKDENLRKNKDEENIS